MNIKIQCILIACIALIFSACKDVVWPEVTPIAKSELTGTWTVSANEYRTKQSFIRTQNLITKDYIVRDTTITDSVRMTFKFGVEKTTGNPATMVEDSVIITTVKITNGIAGTAVVKTGKFAIATTEGNELGAKKVSYINIWETNAKVNIPFANPIVEPYLTYSIISKSSTEMQLMFTLQNQTAQNSITYNVKLIKQ